MKNTTKIMKLVLLSFVIAVISAFMITAAYAETVANGSFANSSYAPNATWTWELDENGTLTIGGNSSDGSTAFVYGASYTREVCPWKRTGVINGVSVKKIVILEETGITTIGATSLSYARYCEEIVLPLSVTKIQGFEPMVGNLSLKTVSFAGASDAGEGVYDLRNFTSIPSGAFKGNASSQYISDGVTVMLGEKTQLPSASTDWSLFGSIKIDSTTYPTASKVTFKVDGKNTAAISAINAKIEQQKSSSPDTTMPTDISLELYGTVSSGTFANDSAPNATWTWEFDYNGTLTIGGKHATGSTKFDFGAKNSKAYYPWGRTGLINDMPVKKIVILDETGITQIGEAALSFTFYCEEIVIPATVTAMAGYQPMIDNPMLKTVTVSGTTGAGEGVYDLRNITTIPVSALKDNADASAVPEGVVVMLGEKTSIPDADTAWNWFNSASKVTFKVHAKNSNAIAKIGAKIEQQNGSSPDTTLSTNISLEIYGYVAEGNFATSVATATWTYTLDYYGTLTIGGKASGGSTNFTYGAQMSRANCPWQRTGIINNTQIKKVIILEETGITSIGSTALSYLPYCEEIVIPSTVTQIVNYESMCGNPRLKTVSVAGVTDAGEGIYDFRNITRLAGGSGSKVLAGNADARYVPEGIEVWLGENVSVPDANSTWEWFGPVASEGVQAAAKVTFMVYKDSEAAARISEKVAQQSGSSPDATVPTNISVKYYPLPTYGTDTTYGWYSWDFDKETGTLTFTRLESGWAELYFPYDGITTWIDEYREQIKHIVVPSFSQYSDSRGLYPFSNLPNLETVKWDTKSIANGSGKDGKGMFYNCPKLTTFCSSQNFEEGLVDLSGITFTSVSSKDYLKNMFYGCKSIEKVLLNNIKLKDSNGQLPFVIGASMFEGCTSLCSVDVFGATAIQSAAFKNCSSLGGTLLYTGDTNIGDAFYGCGGVVISTNSAEKASAMLKSMQDAGVSISNAMVSCMSHGGFAVRTASYNGLRSFYSFVGETNVDFDNLTLVEYGSIAATDAVYALYTKDIGGEGSIITLDGTEFKTPAKVVKTAVYIADGYTGDVAKYKTVNEDGSVNFVVTVTNFAPANYNSGVVMNGYEIWKDGEGRYYLIITEYPNDDYKVNSLYKTTVGMLIDGVIDLGTSESPVYQVIASAEQTPIASPDENVEAFLIDHPIKSGKKVAVYSTDSAEMIELKSLDIPAEYIGSIVDFAFSGNVKCDNIPTIDDYWQEHINAQLSTLPAGKSFIAITDTHYESSNGNIGKSADLMQYVRKTTGIDKVVNLGDPYHQENTYAGALTQLSRSMEEKFFDYFGDDGLYAIGNHDSNITIARTIDDEDAGTYKMDILLKDTDIYEKTVAHIAEGGERNGNVVFNDELIEIIKANKNNIKGFVLDNVSPENNVKGLFGNVNYSAEEMYENLLAWAKLHYAYYDHEAKICYLVLNTGGLTLTDFTTLGLELWKFNPCQYNFVDKILKQVSESYSDYDIVVAGHMLYNAQEVGSSGNEALVKMLAAFESGGKVAFTGSGNNEISGALMGGEGTSKYLEYDYANRSFTGEIICVTGHWHIDLQMVSNVVNGSVQYNLDYNKNEATENSIPLFVLNQDNAKEKMSDHEPDTQVPVEGTITEQCFTIFTITEDNKLVVTRIGANSGWLQNTYNLK